MVVKLLTSVYKGMIKHAESGYPNEVCGVLIGTGNTISNFKECRNLNKERARDRYELDPLSFKEADDWARANKLEILGVYHSHPDHPPRPSEFDREHAWPGWVYIILSIGRGKHIDTRAWTLNEHNHFKEEKIELIEDNK
jgi:proteasome lid subunit RPN8/RPN11